MLSAAPSTSRLLPPQERLREKAFEYCQRLIEQSNRRESPGRHPPSAASGRGQLTGGSSPGSSFFPGSFSFSSITPKELSTGRSPAPGSSELCPPASVPTSQRPGGSPLASSALPLCRQLVHRPPRARRAQHALSLAVFTPAQRLVDRLPSPRSPEEGGRRPAESGKCRAGQAGWGGAHLPP